jgi:two-component system, NtrC family, sensor kinase
VPRLLVIQGADEGKQFELAEEVISVGRDASNNIRLHDTEISRRHAEFRQTPDGYNLVDIGSANGSFVNNKKIEVVPLQPGDHVAFGQTLLVYSTGRPEAQAESGDLAEKISLITRNDLELSSAIVKTINEAEGSRLLSQPDEASPWLKSALANLAIMYEASQAVSHILDINQLLDRILELVFRTVPADRGCVMLTTETDALVPKALRWRKDGDRQEVFQLSRTIVDHVLKERQGILVSDAARDDRFTAGQSIVRFGIREVICVPMKGRHETMGVFYLDTQTTGREIAKQKKSALSKFTEDHLALAIAIAHQAALAVEETRYHHAMVQAERLAAIGQTIAALSHHIKNILQGLRSGSEILKMGLAEKNDKLVQQGWRVAEKSQGKIYDLVMDMLSYSKERVPAVEPTDINAVVKEIVELLAPRAQELSVTLELSLGENVPEVQADPEGLHRALLNIVGNAIDAVEGRPEPKVTVGTRADEHWARILVLDNGVGIPPAQLAEIFKPFVSTKGARGTGLGLPVSRKIMREHGGDLTVHSQVGAGSKFTLRLPVKSPLSQEPGVTVGEMPVYPPAEE